MFDFFVQAFTTFLVTGINVVGRVLGILLAALAAQYVIDGIRESGALV